MTNSNRFHYVTNVILIAFFSITIFSCSNDDNEPPVKEEEPTEAITEISQEIKDLVYFKGDEKAPKVLINVQAGPSTELAENIVEFIVATFDTTDILTVNPHQVQTLDPNILEGIDMTLDQAVNSNSQSVETLHQVISYFKDQGRTVYVVGFSYGAFLTQELIAQKGIDVADKYLIISGRLDINDVMWQGLTEGKEGYFDNGITPIVEAEPHESVIERNLLRLNAGLGRNRYTAQFDTIESLSDITYIFGATDEAVGGLTTEEVAFLELKNANILSGNGGHDVPFEGFVEQGFRNAFGILLLQ